MVTAEMILAIKPKLLKTPRGWLAVSGKADPLTIGVDGASEEEAEEAFAKALERWAAGEGATTEF